VLLIFERASNIFCLQEDAIICSSLNCNPLHVIFGDFPAYKGGEKVGEGEIG
jgi:hypothetical protein